MGDQRGRDFGFSTANFLPEGKIVFCSTRFGGREEYHGFRVSTLFTMTDEGKEIRPLTYHVVNDREPKVTARGKIVFVRQDNFFMNAKIETEIHHIDADGARAAQATPRP